MLWPVLLDLKPFSTWNHLKKESPNTPNSNPNANSHKIQTISRLDQVGQQLWPVLMFEGRKPLWDLRVSWDRSRISSSNFQTS